jgi:NFU1 iron-sulfur cluster scaffold homolog, mitochondrial
MFVLEGFIKLTNQNNRNFVFAKKANMETQAAKIIEIYTESTPNPKMLKFVTTQMLLPNMILDCKTVKDATESPLAQELYKLPYIDTVFISNNFITLGKKEVEEEWFELSFEIKEILKQYLKSDLPVVTESFLAKQKADKENFAPENEIDAKIIQLLEKYVKPAVEMDGGYIGFKSFENGVVKLSMQGACSGCPSSNATLKDGIEAMLKRMVPEVTEVVAFAE